jgi:replicative DNA helicase
MASELICCEASYAEFDMLTALYELAIQNPERGRAVSLKLTPQMFLSEGTADAFRLVRGVLSACEQPTMSDITRHEHYTKCQEIVIDVLAKGAGNLCAYSLGAERYVHELRAEYSRLQAERATEDLSALVKGGASPAEISEAARAVSDAASAIETDSRTPTLHDALQEYLQMDAVPTIPTEFQPFDRLGGGFPIGGLTVLAAPPSVGKSALSLQLTLGAMQYDQSLVAIWCLGEMTLEAFARRAICHWSTRGDQSRVSMTSAEQRTDLARGSAINIAMHIGDRLKLVKPPLSIDRIEAEVIQSKAKLVVIDYVQLVELGDAQDRRAEIDGVVRRLRRLSIEHGVAVVGVSNVSKIVSAETRIGAIGKESSELDFAADLLLLGVADDRENQDGLRAVKWACKKNRHGQCLDADTMFDGRLQTFTDASALPDPALDDWGRM